MKQYKIVMISLGARGHVTPLLGIARELVSRKQQVTFFSTSEFSEDIENVGCAFRPYESPFDQLMSQGAEARSRLSHESVFENCLVVLPQLLPAILLEQPDVIIYDQFCFAGLCVAEILHIRAISVVPTYAHNEHFSVHLLMKGKHLEATPRFNRIARELSDTYGVELFANPLDARKPQPLNLVLVPSVFHYASSTFDSRYVFVGPTVATRLVDDTLRVRRPQRKVFVSLGTVSYFNDSPAFFRHCLEALGDGSWDVFISSGARVDVSAFEPIPNHVCVRPFFNQLEVLNQVDLFVSHGGMGSTMEALYFGVPMVVVPQSVEQAATARRIVDLGLGVALTSTKLSSLSLLEAVRSVYFDATIKARVLSMQKQVRASGGAPEAVDHIVKYLSMG